MTASTRRGADLAKSAFSVCPPRNVDAVVGPPSWKQRLARLKKTRGTHCSSKTCFFPSRRAEKGDESVAPAQLAKHVGNLYFKKDPFGTVPPVPIHRWLRCPRKAMAGKTRRRSASLVGPK